MDSLYAHHHELLAVFRFFDVKKDNVISKEEFRQGCRIIRQLNTVEGTSTNSAGSAGSGSGGALSQEDSDFDRECDMLLEIMNLNGSGFIDINDFLEMFRVSDAMKKKLGQYQDTALTGGVEGRDKAAGAAVTSRRSSYNAMSEPKRRSSLKAVPPPTAISIHGAHIHGD